MFNRSRDVWLRTRGSSCDMVSPNALERIKDWATSGSTRHPAAHAWRRVDPELSCARPGDPQTSSYKDLILSPQRAFDHRQIVLSYPTSAVNGLHSLEEAAWPERIQIRWSGPFAGFALHSQTLLQQCRDQVLSYVHGVRQSNPPLTFLAL